MSLETGPNGRTIRNCVGEARFGNNEHLIYRRLRLTTKAASTYGGGTYFSNQNRKDQPPNCTRTY